MSDKTTATNKKCTARLCGKSDYTEFSTCRHCGHRYADTDRWDAPKSDQIGEFLRSPFQVLIALILLGTGYYAITKHNPENLLGDGVNAVIQYGDKTEHEKIRRCSELLDREPNDVDALEKRGDAYVKILNSKAALVDYTRAINIAPSRRLYQKRAIAFDSLGQYKNARQDEAQASRGER